MSSRSSAGPEVVIIGAGGGMGREFARNFSALNLSVAGIDTAGGPNLLNDDVFALSSGAVSLISNANLVILALPDEIAVDAAKGLLPHLPPTSALMDCTSIKSEYAKILGGASKHVKVSVNPLFGPGLAWAGQTMAVTLVTNGTAAERWLNAFRAMGLNLVILDAANHDRLAAQAQVAAHSAFISFFISVDEESARFDTPPNRLLRLMSARMLSAEAHVYWSIQLKNPFASAARRRLRDGLNRLDQLVEGGDEEGFQAMWNEQASKLGAQLEARAARCRRMIENLNDVEKSNE